MNRERLRVNRRATWILVTIMVLLAVAITGFSVAMLYRTAFEQQRQRLVELADSRARLIEAMYRRSMTEQSTGDYATREVLAQLKDADSNFPGFGDSGEFVLARLEGEKMVFMLHNRNQGLTNPATLPVASDLAEPMRRVLKGKTGSLVGPDYRGVSVLAAHQPVQGLKWGVVAKMDLTEIRQPFIDTLRDALLVGLLLVLLGIAVFLRVGGAAMRRLEISENSYRSLFDKAADGIVTVDRNGDIQSANAAAYAMFGHSQQERAPGSFDSWVPDFKAALQRAKAAGHTQVLEAVGQRGDGSEFPVEIDVGMQPAADGAVMTLLLRDVTQRRHFERALRQHAEELENRVEQRTRQLSETLAQLKESQRQSRLSEQRFRGLVESTSDWIWEADVDGRYTYASPKVLELLGYRPNTLIGKSALELMPPAEAARMGAEIERLRAALQPFNQLHYTVLHADGSEVILESSGVPIWGPNNELLGYRGVDRDITRRVQTENKLHDTEAMFAHFADNVRDMFWVRDAADGSMLYASRAYETIWGDPVESLLADPLRFTRFIHPDDFAWVTQRVQETFTRGGLDIEYRIVRADGGLRWVHTRSMPVCNTAGEVFRIVGTAEDITERKQAEESRLLHERRQRDSLVREVHHRIKNNLQGIVGLLRQQLSDYPGLEDLLAQVINQVQAISLVYGLHGRSQTIYLCEVVQAIARSTAETYAGEVELDLDLAAETPLALADDDAVPVALIVNELFTNAVKHGTPGQRIEVALSGSAENAELLVRNQSRGKVAADEAGSRDELGGEGLRLMRALLPRRGAQLGFDKAGVYYAATLQLQTPVISPWQPGMRQRCLQCRQSDVVEG